MKLINTPSIIFAFFFTSILFGQTPVIDKSNCREGENVEYCTSHKKMEERLKDLEALKMYKEEQKAYEILESQKKSSETEKSTIYKIPIVFHVLHNGGPEKISRDQILNQVSIINRDYRLQNTDANTVHSDFIGMPADIEVEFVLATIAPNGNCFSGVTYTQNALTSDGSSGNNQVAAIKAGNDVYQGSWPGNQYLNVFVCAEIGGAAGYTFTPSNFKGSNMENGIWILHNYVGNIGTSSERNSRALTHEIGHWLNLEHTWGSTNSPGNPSSCNIDDKVSDTPVTIGVTSCSVNSNSCDDLNTAVGVTSSWTYDVVDNVENYMDYSYCSKMFTPGQKSRMRTALQASIGGRNNIWTTNNLNLTGANGSLTICKADFSSDKTIICAGDSIHFQDNTYNAVTGWTWTLTGATPATSSVQNPGVVYNTPGKYTVVLSATDGLTTQTATKTAYITVLPASVTLPFFDGFENYTSLSNIVEWTAVDGANNGTFTLLNSPSAAATGQKCVKLNNFGQVGSNVDELNAIPVDLSGLAPTDIVTLTFKYAYRKVNTSDVEYLRIIGTNNCGDVWNTRKTIGGNTLSNLTATSSWTPSSASDWTTMHVTNINSSYFVSNFRYKFRFEGSGGNNIYLDDINLYKGSPSNTNVLNVNSENTINSVYSIYPNPAEDEVNIEFNVDTDQDVVFNILDVTGNVVQSNLIKAQVGSNLVLLNTEKLSSGMYLLNIATGNSIQTSQFVIR
jgi:PKD repeat protein